MSSNNRGGKKKFQSNPSKKVVQVQQKRTTILDKMVDVKEFESLLSHRFTNVNIVQELRDSIAEIEAIRGKEVVCYFSNIVKQIKMPIWDSSINCVWLKNIDIITHCN